MDPLLVLGSMLPVVALENDRRPWPHNVAARFEVFVQSLERYERRLA